MKPLNNDDPGCNYTSSNCVIWQGPDLDCIKLCKGDSVSDVVFKLATELCAIAKTLDISTYDLSCLNLVTAPRTFHEFLQLMIQTICALQSATGVITPIVVPATQEMPVARMFQYTNAFGDLVTTMPLPNYVTAIGNEVNTQNGQIDAIQTTVARHSDQITTLQTEVSNIPASNVQLIIPACVAPAAPTDPNTVLIALEQQFCQLQGATGNASEIFAAIQKQCVGLSTSPTLGGGGGNMASLPGWDATLLNLSAAINNIWITLCDTRAAILNIQANCCPTACSGITLNLTTTLATTNLTIYLTGTIPSGFLNCAQAFNVTISDTTGSSINIFVDLVTILNNPAGFVVDLSATPINLSSDINTSITACLDNSATGAHCQSVLNYLLINVANCPVMTYLPSTDSISYSGTSLAGTNTYTVELWNNTGTVLISSQTQMVTFPALITGTFSGLIINSLFRARVIVTNSVGVATSCAFVPVALTPTIITPIALGTAGLFAALAGAGIASVGTSTFIGNVGSDPTNTVSGILPGDVTGVLYTVSDPTVILAKVDLGIAIADASGRTATTLPSDIIGGTVIAPGVWNTPGGTIDVAGNVTFDAGGDPSAVFILSAATTLTISAGATITLLGGATFNNIFWNIGTSINVGAGATTAGIFMARTNIIIGAGSNIHGAMLTQNGLQDIDTSTINNV